MNKCNVSLNGYNLLTFSKANKFDIDPEIGDGNSTPIRFQEYTPSVST